MGRKIWLVVSGRLKAPAHIQGRGLLLDLGKLLLCLGDELIHLLAHFFFLLVESSYEFVYLLVLFFFALSIFYLDGTF